MKKNLFDVLKERKQIVKVSAIALFGAAAMYMSPVCFATKPGSSAEEKSDDMQSVVSTVLDDEHVGSNSEQVEHRVLPEVQATKTHTVQSDEGHGSTVSDDRLSSSGLLANSDLRLGESDDVSFVSYDEAERVLRINKEGCYTISCAKEQTDNRIEVTANEGNVFLTLNGINIVTKRPNTAALNIVGDCDVVIDVKGKNKLSSGDNCAGLQKDGKGVLTLQGRGKLDVSGGRCGAGIGGGAGKNGEKIKIVSAKIDAQGGDLAAGIGGGANGNGECIVIEGGDVLAQGGDSAAGIGGGANGSGSTIYIESGKVVAQGGVLAAGIGGGEKGIGVKISILGGSINAEGGYSSDMTEGCMPGIGGGYCAQGDGILILAQDILVSGGINGKNIRVISRYTYPMSIQLLDFFNMERIIETEAIAKSDENGTLVCSPIGRVCDFSACDDFYECGEAVKMRTIVGPIFSHMPNECEPYQRVTGDCIFVSLLMSFAKRDPKHLVESIRDNGDETVTVRFYDSERRPFYYRIKKTIPEVYTQKNCEWAALIEKAFACHNKFMQEKSDKGRVYYDRIDQHVDFVFRSLTDRLFESITDSVPAKERWDALADEFSLLTSADDCALSSVRRQHCFAILKTGCIDDLGIRFLVVRDPHGDLVPLYEHDMDHGIILSSLSRTGRNGIFVVLESEFKGTPYFDRLTVKRYKK